ncbi:MAG TPA: PqqD family protein [Acidimicrobiales bacterium]|nr:PqqD family protein [Acidimicrobiales bacterium]
MPKGSVVSTVVDEETVLVDIVTGQVHLLDPVGTAVWSCFDGSATVQELVADLADVYSAEHDQVYGDVVTFARQLGGKGLLEGVLADGL